ncbi:MAG: leucine--tRNA ligase, partial [Candidatus Margulisiibacteriota bacterium]
TASDIISRYKRMQGYKVLHPMGWDAFGLPAENYAIKTGTHPSICTQQNINTFRKQIKALGFSYDWDREVDTTDPDYFKWTQWIFLKLFEKGLAYEANVPINWCGSCLTGLANEEVADGKCDRCGHAVVKKDLRQWMLKITAYAERLLDDLEKLNWPEPIKIMQRNWIGKSAGAEVDFPIAGHDLQLKVFTTRPDTLFGATYMVMAPEHSFVDVITTPEQSKAVKEYQHQTRMKSDLERTHLDKTKTGVFTGAYALNPVNGEQIPIWVADYVMMSYGTGAIMAVPAHDQRDFEFAKTFGLPIIQVVKPEPGSEEENHDFEESAFDCDGTAINSEQFDGQTTPEFKANITKWLEERGEGKKAINYKLRDWVFSRQRYWGEPIPIVHCRECGIVGVPEEELPLTLPEVERYEPTGTGESPLANIDEWVNTTCPKCGGPAKRETNTMPQWAGSCWYFLRYIDPNNNKALADKAKLDYWMPVDLYIGGAEHAVLHLLYSRFWYKFMYDIGVVSQDEPFQKLVNQGLILAEDGLKMSKSLGNVINPDDIIAEYGADAMRIYEMFMGPLEMAKPWVTNGLVGVKRFLEKAWRLYEDTADNGGNVKTQGIASLEKTLHKTIAKVSGDIETLNLNTAVSALMILVNEMTAVKTQGIASPDFAPLQKTLALLLAPFAPHLAEELWQMLGETGSIHHQQWPTYDPAMLVEDEITLVVQVNGKVRDKITASADSTEDQLKELALSSDKVKIHLDGKTIRKVIVVPKKLVSVVVG